MKKANAGTPAPLGFRGLRAFFACELRVQLHEETAIATSMLTQAVLLTFVWLLAPSLFPVALVGAILFSTFALGQRVLNEAAYIRIDHKLHELFLASPLAPESYFLGTALGVLGAYSAPIVVLGGLAVVVLHPSVLAGLLLVGGAILVWLFASSLGYVLSTLFRDQRAIWSYSGLLYSLFGVLPPVFYPLALFPVALRPLALILPPSGAAALVNEALNPGTLSFSETVLAAGALLGLSLGLFAFAVYWARRSVREG
jgi:ABC-2 type transport system permease protein